MKNSHLENDPLPRSAAVATFRSATRCWRWLFIFTAFALALMVFKEMQLFERVARKVSPETFPWRKVDAELFQSWHRETAIALRHSKGPESWLSGCLAFGIVRSSRAGNGSGEISELVCYGDALIDLDGHWRRAPGSVEAGLAGLALIALHEHTGNPRYQKAARQLAEYLLREYPRSETMTLPYSASQREVMLVDTLGITVPFLAQYGVHYHDDVATDLAVRQLMEFLDKAIDLKTGLPWHAYQTGGVSGFGLPAWTRGTGWLAVGLVETLAALPEDHPAHPCLLAAFRALLQTAAQRQLADGSWGWALSIPQSRSDSSGTAMLAYAIERGRQIGVLNSSYEAVSVRAMEHLARVTNQRGDVTGALGECQGVGHYPRVFGTYPYTQGFATAALAVSLQRQGRVVSVATPASTGSTTNSLIQDVSNP